MRELTKSRPEIRPWEQASLSIRRLALRKSPTSDTSGKAVDYASFTCLGFAPYHNIVNMLQNLVITAPVSEDKVEELRGAFGKVTYHPDGKVDAQTASEADIWYTTWLGLPNTVTSLEQVPNTKVIQLSSGRLGISFTSLG